VKIIAVVGSGSGCGKTTAACRILRAIPGLGAVKISPRPGTSRIEWGRGESGKDTDLLAESGAACVARIIGPRDEVVRTWTNIQHEFERCRGVVVEGSRSLDLPGERFVVIVSGESMKKSRKDHSMNHAGKSNVILPCKTHIDDRLLKLFEVSSHNSILINNCVSRADDLPGDIEKDFIERIRLFLGIQECG
jgi:hypothetical protein